MLPAPIQVMRSAARDSAFFEDASPPLPRPLLLPLEEEAVLLDVAAPAPGVALGVARST